MGDSLSPTPASRVSVSPAREAYLAYERSSPATRRPLSDFLPHLRLEATMEAYGHPPGSIYRSGGSPVPEHGSDKRDIPIQEVDENQEEQEEQTEEETEEETLKKEHLLTQLLNKVGKLDVKDVVNIAQLTGMKTKTIKAIEKENITGDEWKQIMKGHIGKPDWDMMGRAQLHMTSRDNIRYKGITAP